MKKSGVIRLLVLFLVSVLILGTADELNAQSKKGKGKKGSGKSKKVEKQLKEDKDTNEDSIDSLTTGKKKKTGKQHRGDKKKKKDSIGSPATGRKKDGYRPKKLKNKDEAEWEDGTPPGWSRGKKSGWNGAGAPPGKMKDGEKGAMAIEKEYPPGSEDWDESEKEEFEKDLEEAKERVRRRARQREGATQEDEESAVRSVEGAAREGVPVERAESTVKRAIERDLNGEEIEKVTRAISYGADKNIDYEKLDSFLNKKIESGERGDDLALSIYKEVDSGTMEKVEEKKVPWWKRVFKRD